MSFIIGQSNSSDIMGCVLCEMAIEAAAAETIPAAAFVAMYRRCARMGLLEPVCDHMVDKHAKQLLIAAHNPNLQTPSHICAELNLCER